VAEAGRIVATILGCGSSGGVPRVGGDWGLCDPTNPRNRRRRCALLLTGTTPGMEGTTQVVIDTGCDIREQLLEANVNHVDGVFYTHEHADHTHGIDDLRGFVIKHRRRVDVYLTEVAAPRIMGSFSYCFVQAPESDYPPILDAHMIAAGQPVVIEGAGGSIRLLPFLQAHGDITSLGFRIGRFAYSCDLSAIPPESEPSVSNLQVWVLDALRQAPHPSHLSLAESVELIGRMKPREAVLTNMHLDLDYAEVDRTTPANVRPAYDGLQIDVTTGTILSPR
jgi:phosphoribosyl 1,2-cyclic phosphate phosphodiesterase